MTRVSKKDRLKNCSKKPRFRSPKTGPLKDNLPKGFKEHTNAFEASKSVTTFIAKVK